jgi:hypothetical protein
LRLALALPAIVLLGSAEAGTITVADTGASSGSTCTLAQAINAANAANGVSAASVGSSTPVGNCTGATAGLNYITFSGWPTITLTSVDNYWYGPNALPPIASTIWIGAYPGTGARLMASHTGDPDPTTGNAFRFFYVSGGLPGELPAGYLVLLGLSLEGGHAKGGDSGGGGGGAGMGGAIFNQGVLELTNVSLVGNTARGGASGANGQPGGGGMGGDGGGFGGGFGGGIGGPFGGSGGSFFNGGGGGGGFTTASAGSSNNSDGGGLGGLGGFGSAGSFGGGGYGGDGGGGGGGYSNYGGGGSFGNGGGYGFGGGTCYNESCNFFPGGGGGGGVGGGGGGALIFQNIGGGGGGGGFGGGAGAGASTAKGGFGGGGGSAGFGAGTGGSGMGGAIFNHRGSLFMINVTATGNVARGGAPNGSGLGAVLFNLNGMATIDFSTLAGNTLAGSNAAGDANGASDGSVYSLAYGNKIEDGSASSASLKINKSIIRATHVDAGNANDDVAVNVVNGAHTNTSSLAYVGQSLITHSYTTAGVVQSGSSPSTVDPGLGALSLSTTWSSNCRCCRSDRTVLPTTPSIASKPMGQGQSSVMNATRRVRKPAVRFAISEPTNSTAITSSRTGTTWGCDNQRGRVRRLEGRRQLRHY